MLLALTGTPGTGKTALADILREKGIEVHDVDSLAREHGCLGDYDDARDTREVDVEALAERIGDLHSREVVVIEGHLSHHLAVDRVVVLRCRPDVLRGRLEAKGWHPDKVRENLQAEVLGVIISEAMGAGTEVSELDTTKDSVEQVAGKVLKVLSGDSFAPEVDWLEDYEELLFEKP